MSNYRTITNKYFPLIFTLIFFILSIVLLLRHEFWRDEVTAWNLASDSNSYVELFNKISKGYGHPFLWPYILYLFSHYVINNIEIMKFIHLIFSFLNVFIILKYSPFNKLIKVLIIFNYFMFYEYSIISRNYAIGIFFILLFCVLLKNFNKFLIVLSVLLFLMSQTNLYSFMISIVFFILMVKKIFINKEIELKKENIFKILMFFLIFFSGVILLFIQFKFAIFEGTVVNKPIYKILNNISYKSIIKNLVYGIIKGFLPISKFNLNFWNTNIILDLFSKFNIIFILLLSLVLIIITVLVLKKSLILFYIFGIISILSIPAFIYRRFDYRHSGHMFILLLAFLWLSKEEPSGKMINLYCVKLRFFTKKLKFTKIASFLLIVLLVLSCISTITAFYFDYRYPFSNGKAVAKFIVENYNCNDVFIAGYQNYAIETIATYLSFKIFYPEENNFGKTPNFSSNNKELNVIDSFNIANKYIQVNRKLLFIKNYSFLTEEDLTKLNINFKLLKNINFTNSIEQSENYYLYEFIKK